ncbi:MAG: hypothetical protein JW909_12685 [Planctomycetes bacterium]|nr:hypothetical protein [Planctomycetota bacterium]
MKWTMTLVLLCGACLGLERSDLCCRAEVKGELTPGKPARISLPREVLSAARADFADVRLFDETGKEIPYVVYDRKGKKQSEEEFRFKVLSYDEARGVMTLTLERPDNVGEYSEIEIETRAKDFKMRVEVGVGDSLDAIPKVGEDAIFDFSSRIPLRKTVLDMPVLNGKYLSLRLHNEAGGAQDGQQMHLKYDGLDFSVNGAAKQFKIDGVSGRTALERTGGYVYESASIELFDVDKDNNGDTLIKLKDINLPSVELELEIDNSYYYRTIRVSAADEDRKENYRGTGSAVVYRIPGMRKSANVIGLSGVKRRNLLIRVVNGDNPVLNVRKVTLRWVRKCLYFIPEEYRTYTLYYGATSAPVPDYELRNLLGFEQANAADVTEAGIAKLEDNPEYSGPKGDREHPLQEIIFTGMIVLLVIVAGVWVYKLAQKIPASTTGAEGDGSSGDQPG